MLFDPVVEYEGAPQLTLYVNGNDLSFPQGGWASPITLFRLMCGILMAADSHPDSKGAYQAFIHEIIRSIKDNDAINFGEQDQIKSVVEAVLRANGAAAAAAAAMLVGAENYGQQVVYSDGDVETKVAEKVLARDNTTVEQLLVALVALVALPAQEDEMRPIWNTNMDMLIYNFRNFVHARFAELWWDGLQASQEPIWAVNRDVGEVSIFRASDFALKVGKVAAAATQIQPSNLPLTGPWSDDELISKWLSLHRVQTLSGQYDANNHAIFIMNMRNLHDFGTYTIENGLLNTFKIEAFNQLVLTRMVRNLSYGRATSITVTVPPPPAEVGNWGSGGHFSHALSDGAVISVQVPSGASVGGEIEANIPLHLYDITSAEGEYASALSQRACPELNPTFYYKASEPQTTLLCQLPGANAINAVASAVKENKWITQANVQGVVSWMEGAPGAADPRGVVKNFSLTTTIVDGNTTLLDKMSLSDLYIYARCGAGQPWQSAGDGAVISSNQMWTMIFVNIIQFRNDTGIYTNLESDHLNMSAQELVAAKTVANNMLTASGLVDMGTKPGWPSLLAPVASPNWMCGIPSRSLGALNRILSPLIYDNQSIDNYILYRTEPWDVSKFRAEMQGVFNTLIIWNDSKSGIGIMFAYIPYFSGGEGEMPDTPIQTVAGGQTTLGCIRFVSTLSLGDMEPIARDVAQAALSGQEGAGDASLAILAKAILLSATAITLFPITPSTFFWNFGKFEKEISGIEKFYALISSGDYDNIDGSEGQQGGGQSGGAKWQPEPIFTDYNRLIGKLGNAYMSPNPRSSLDLQELAVLFIGFNNGLSNPSNPTTTLTEKASKDEYNTFYKMITGANPGNTVSERLSTCIDKCINYNLPKLSCTAAELLQGAATTADYLKGIKGNFIADQNDRGIIAFAQYLADMQIPHIIAAFASQPTVAAAAPAVAGLVTAVVQSFNTGYTPPPPAPPAMVPIGKYNKAAFTPPMGKKEKWAVNEKDNGPRWTMRTGSCNMAMHVCLSTLELAASLLGPANVALLAPGQASLMNSSMWYIVRRVLHLELSGLVTIFNPSLQHFAAALTAAAAAAPAPAIASPTLAGAAQQVGAAATASDVFFMEMVRLAAAPAPAAPAPAEVGGLIHLVRSLVAGRVDAAPGVDWDDLAAVFNAEPATYQSLLKLTFLTLLHSCRTGIDAYANLFTATSATFGIAKSVTDKELTMAVYCSCATMACQKGAYENIEREGVPASKLFNSLDPVAHAGDKLLLSEISIVHRKLLASPGTGKVGLGAGQRGVTSMDKTGLDNLMDLIENDEDARNELSLRWKAGGADPGDKLVAKTQTRTNLEWITGFGEITDNTYSTVTPAGVVDKLYINQPSTFFDKATEVANAANTNAADPLKGAYGHRGNLLLPTALTVIKDTLKEGLNAIGKRRRCRVNNGSTIKKGMLGIIPFGGAGFNEQLDNMTFCPLSSIADAAGGQCSGSNPITTSIDKCGLEYGVMHIKITNNPQPSAQNIAIEFKMSSYHTNSAPCTADNQKPIFAMIEMHVKLGDEVIINIGKLQDSRSEYKDPDPTTNGEPASSSTATLPGLKIMLNDSDTPLKAVNAVTSMTKTVMDITKGTSSWASFVDAVSYRGDDVVRRPKAIKNRLMINNKSIVKSIGDAAQELNVFANEGGYGTNGAGVPQRWTNIKPVGGENQILKPSPSPLSAAAAAAPPGTVDGFRFLDNNDQPSTYRAFIAILFGSGINSWCAAIKMDPSSGSGNNGQLRAKYACRFAGLQGGPYAAAGVVGSPPRPGWLTAAMTNPIPPATTGPTSNLWIYTGGWATDKTNRKRTIRRRKHKQPKKSKYQNKRDKRKSTLKKGKKNTKKHVSKKKRRNTKRK